MPTAGLRRQLTAGSALSPKSCLPSSFAEAAEDKSGLSSIALARRMIFFGPLPPFLRAASPYLSLRKKADAVTDWNGTRLLYIFACLH